MHNCPKHKKTMQNYSIETYAETFPREGKKLSRMTIQRMIENNQLPTRHVPKKIGKVWIIQVFDYSPSELCDAIAECCEVLRSKEKISLPLIATECLKRGLSMKHICRILDVKME